MAKPEWGTKRICQSCSAPFYDLRRHPIVCPKCKAVFDPEAVLKSRKLKGAEEIVVTPKATVADPEDILKAVVDDDDADDIDDVDDVDDAVLEDTSDLDDEDVTSVIETRDDKDEI